MRKLLLVAVLLVSAFGGTAWAREHNYCNENLNPPIGECHANHGHPKAH